MILNKEVVEKYEFLYSEAFTMSTALTDPKYFPVTPLLDFNLFNFCRKNNISVGLFYRDIYWRFSKYKEEGSILKRLIAINFCKRDLEMYNKYLDVIFLPSRQMANYLPELKSNRIIGLPPGCESKVNFINKEKLNGAKLHLFYIGGIDKNYI